MDRAPKKRTRISYINALLMISVSLVLDLIQVLSKVLWAFPMFGGPLLSMLIGSGVGVVSHFIFLLWFYLSGVKKIEEEIRHPLVFFSFKAAEMAPIVNFFPLITANNVWGIMASWKSDQDEYEKDLEEFKKAQAKLNRRNLDQYRLATEGEV